MVDLAFDGLGIHQQLVGQLILRSLVERCLRTKLRLGCLIGVKKKEPASNPSPQVACNFVATSRHKGGGLL
jgi:hypothetical protein